MAGVTTLVQRHWTGRQAERWTYRFATHLPLRASSDALLVNWLELTITTDKSSTPLFHNAWITNHGLTAQTVVALAQVGRTRWKIENEAINVLKNHRYPLEHTLGFDVSRGPGGANGHGQNHLSTVLFSLNLLAFLTHTAQHLVDDAYRLLRQTLAVHRTFCPDLKALTRYILFESWDALFAFRVDGLELAIPPP